MRFDDDRESSNVEDRRGAGGFGGLPIGGRSIGVGTAVLALAAWYFGIDPSIVINGSRMLQQGASQEQRAPANESAEEKQSVHFVKVVLNDLEKTWRVQLPAQTGRAYADPRLVLFRGATQTACGAGEAAMGPFYCPADQRVYIDLAFYDEMRRRFKAPGDFAQAYVIAHEVGHHIQNLLGISDKVHRAQQSGGRTQANALSVRLELQADCFAGAWAYHANKERHVLEAGDIEEAVRAATAIGDDALQQAAQGRVVPDSFTHGSSEQRVRWLRRGLESGNLDSCNTFKAQNFQ